MTYPFDPERDLRCERLRLVFLQPEFLAALIAGPANFTALTGWPVAEAYVDFPGALEYLQEQWESGTADPDFWVYLLLLPDATAPSGAEHHGTVIGLIGYKGGPTERSQGSVEIGYSTAPAYQNQGFATEAARIVTERALAKPEVRAVAACTLAERNSSCRVLEKLGFQLVQTLADPEEGTIWRWERT